MTFSAALAGNLDLLTAVLDEPGADVAATLQQLATDATAAVSDYLGLSIVVRQDDRHLTFTLFAGGATASHVRTSLGFSLQASDTVPNQSTTMSLYAASPGAFVDLAADLAWLTKRPPTDFTLDGHLDVPDDHFALGAESVVNQAVGVLIGRGRSLPQAFRELDDRAAATGTDRLGVAQAILSTLAAPGGE